MWSSKTMLLMPAQVRLTEQSTDSGKWERGGWGGNLWPGFLVPIKAELPSLILSLHSTEVLLLVSSIRAENFEVSFWGKKQSKDTKPYRCLQRGRAVREHMRMGGTGVVNGDEREGLPAPSLEIKMMNLQAWRLLRLNVCWLLLCLHACADLPGLQEPRAASVDLGTGCSEGEVTGRWMP